MLKSYFWMAWQSFSNLMSISYFMSLVLQMKTNFYSTREWVWTMQHIICRLKGHTMSQCLWSYMPAKSSSLVMTVCHRIFYFDYEFSVLNCLYDTVSIMLRKNVEKRQMMKQLDGIFLAVDEICDRGIILEIEPNDVIDKVSFWNFSSMRLTSVIVFLSYNMIRI